MLEYSLIKGTIFKTGKRLIKNHPRPKIAMRFPSLKKNPIEKNKNKNNTTNPIVDKIENEKIS